jgi:hypothetical protein
MYRDPERQLTYWVLKEMRRRCSPRAKPGDYERYFGRGIRVCERWCGPGGLRRFLEDVGPRPSPEHEIDRIDTNGDYEPGNVRWVLQPEQDANRRRSPRCLSDEQEREIVTAVQQGTTRVSLAKRFGVHPMTITAILKRYQGDRQ